MRKINLLIGILAVIFLISSCTQNKQRTDLSGTDNREKTKIEKVILRDSWPIEELALAYENELATLSGIMGRPNPCIEWAVKASSSKDKSEVEFQIYDGRKEELAGKSCIQVIGEQQKINATSEATDQTVYTVKLEDKVIFSGRLNEKEDGPTDKDTLLVKMPSEFTLRKGQHAKTDFRDVEIALNELINFAVKITISSPGGCGENADPRCLGPPPFENEYTIYNDSHVIVPVLNSLYIKVIEVDVDKESATFKIDQLNQLNK